MENVLFKQSLRGFDRQQVLEYIDSLSKQMSRQAQEYGRRQESLENEINSLTRQLQDKSDSLNISRKKLDEMIQELNSLKQTNTELKKQVEAGEFLSTSTTSTFADDKNHGSRYRVAAGIAASVVTVPACAIKLPSFAKMAVPVIVVNSTF